MHQIKKKLDIPHRIQFKTKNLRVKSILLVKSLKAINDDDTKLLDDVNIKKFHNDVYDRTFNDHKMKYNDLTPTYIYADMMDPYEYRTKYLEKCQTNKVIKSIWKNCPQDYGDEDIILESALLDYPDTKSNIKAQLNFIHKLKNAQTNDECIYFYDIKLAYRRYKNFLYLLKYHKPTDFWLVPTFDIDIFWHTHMTDNEGYYTDCMEYLGYFLHHNDKLDEKVLNQDFEKTCKLWESVFKEKYEIVVVRTLPYETASQAKTRALYATNSHTYALVVYSQTDVSGGGSHGGGGHGCGGHGCGGHGGCGGGGCGGGGCGGC